MKGFTPSEADLDRAARRLLQGGLVAFPTETVYGLGADAENTAAVSRIYKAKGRPSNHPVIVHVAPGARLDYWAQEIPAEAYKLAEAFWPGPLTLILRRAEGIAADVSGGQATIGLRCPSHPVAQALLRRFAELKGGEGGVAAPSANKFGQVSPTRAEHVHSEFPELQEPDLLILEGGPSQVGIESTIVDLSRLHEGVGPALLRPGHITADDLAAVLGVAPAAPDKAAPQVSGTLKAHYAPRTPLQLVSRHEILSWAGGFPPPEAALSAPRWVIAGFGEAPFVAAPVAGFAELVWHACPEDRQTYARQLYSMLRELDAQGFDRIVLELPPQTAEWQAVNDRLTRAAAAFEIR